MIELFGLATVLVLLILPRIDDPDAASLGGRITDENLRAIAGATVSATNVFSREVQVAQSDAAGFYNYRACVKGGTPCSPKRKVTGARGYLMWFFTVDSARNWI